jgi:hypothetical protein
MRLPGKPWSVIGLADLEHGLRLGVSVEVIADFIKRDVAEVRWKATALGILPRRREPAEETFN